ncbi:MAG: Hsp20/alpha crystallin family protein [Chromatiales bacterium]|jgi:HSP20 family molecular chaperone IbpA|nr:Hsp20/alpha crystallin family protein [Chromatiales bacterium]MDX9766628.1 Hsp20/alpha crystallin family protein [Ectothiorhodospiraceae bacterium]
MTQRDLEALMWSEACRMLERAERMQRSYFRPRTQQASAWEPPVDMFETEDALWIVVAMPGVTSESLSIHFDANGLLVRGERRLPVAAHGGRVHRLEIPAGGFQRRIALPARPYELAAQELRDGCLYLGLRKL